MLDCDLDGERGEEEKNAQDICGGMQPRSIRR